MNKTEMSEFMAKKVLGMFECDVHVYHSFGKLEYYQLNNLPEKISKHLDTRNIQCIH
ncbi:MAG: hypothetical protein H8E74_01775 [Gammaproteobacteria bacterium]|nr:hypothetical protein [Gammaproteobacteria bacterium]